MPDVLVMQPVLKGAIWGGDQLQLRYGKDAPVERPVGESWEVSCLSDMHSTDVRTKRSLGAIFRDHSGWFLQPEAGRRPFPLLLKLIATRQRLSLQVHPNDEQAQRLNGESIGKRESWLILEAGPKAYLHLGLNPGVGLPELRAAIARGCNDDIASLLRCVKPHPGDVFDIEPGTLHSIGPDLVLLEVQQPSDLTYRVWDWGRLGEDGLPRPLHVEKAYQVIRESACPAAIPPLGRSVQMVGERRLSHQHFRLETWQVHGSERLTGQELWLLTCLAGEGRLETAGAEPIVLHRGLTCVVPRGAATVQLTGRNLRLAAVTPVL